MKLDIPEHANLRFDVAPLSRSIQSHKSIVQLLTHADNPICHTLYLALPLRVELRRAENGVGDTCSVDGRVGVHRANDNLQLAVNASFLLRVGANEGESTDTLAVETHVLREGLRERNLVTFLDEVADSERVTRGIARGEALVSHVEEGEQFLLLHDVGNLSPLLLSGVHTGWVVCTSVKKDDALFRSILSTNVSIL